MNGVVHVVADASALADAASVRIAESLREAVAQRGRAFFALAGGSTPRATYERLATMELPWSSVDFLWSDERVVPDDHPQSNVRMAREALLTPLGVETDRIHAPRTPLGGSDAALAYEITVRELDPTHRVPRLDLVLLGLGDDGHTASLFPGGEELDVAPTRLVVPSVAPVEPHDRVTFTYALLGAARHVMFLVSGESKRPALAGVLAGDEALPAARVRVHDGTLEWWVDEPARGDAQ